MPIPAGPDALPVALDQVKAHLNMSLSDTSQDEELTAMVEAATEVIEHIVGPILARTVVEVHDGGGGVLALRQPPVLSLISVTEGGVTSSAWSVLPGDVAVRSSGVAPAGRGTVTVTYQAGRASVPASIALALKELVATNFRAQQGGNYSPFDSAGDGTTGGGDVILGFFVPNRVRQLLLPHEQLAGIA